MVMIAAGLIWAVTCAAEPIVLDNGAIRIEVAPEVFSLRFVGFSGGRNFIEPLPYEDSASKEAWLDSGGFTTDVLPGGAGDAALRRGPGEVLLREPLKVVLLSPASDKARLRVKKEIEVDAGRGRRAWYRVAVVVDTGVPEPYFVRNTARVPSGSTLRVRKEDANIQFLSEKAMLAPVVVTSMQYWLIPVPPTHRTRNALLGGYLETVEMRNRDGIWRRRIETMPTGSEAVEQSSTFVCILDDATRSYGASLQGGRQPIRADTPCLFSEEWTFDGEQAFKE